MTGFTPRTWTRYVAIGDSFTEGMCDDDTTYAVGPAPDAGADAPRRGEFAGWADRLAHELALRAAADGQEFRYANLAIRGKLLADITGRQTDAALALEPDLVSIIGGGNDMLRPGADVDALMHQLDEAVARLRLSGADVLMGTPMDPRYAPLIKRLRPKAAEFAAGIWTIANRHGCAVIDQWGLVALRDSRLWAPDRIHMRAEGHRRIGLMALHALTGEADPDEWTRPLEAAPPIGLAQRLRADTAWAREYGVPWIQRRLTGRSSGDAMVPKWAEPTLVTERPDGSTP